MTTAFADLLYAYIPGIYRDKDELGELRRFLEIASLPLEQIENSIGQLYEDFYLSSCRELFVGLIGDLLGVEVDRTLPVRAQRAEVEEAVASYRRKGLQPPILQYAEQITGWPVTLVDFSQTVALSSFIEGLNPIVTHRDAAVAENPGGSGNFFFSADQTITPLYDAKLGRRISRKALQGHESEFAGVENRFAIKEIGAGIFAAAHIPQYTAVAADLTNFASPKKPDGTALTLLVNQVAIDPELGRFKIQNPIPLAGNLRVDFHSLVPSSIAPQVFDLRDALRMARLGRSDDPAPYTLDFRAPRTPADGIGRQHFDNHGFYASIGRVVANQKPNVLPPNSQTGRFTFDNQPIAMSNADGISLQLMDGIDGSAITRRKLAGHELDFCGASRGFHIRISGSDLTDPDFLPRVTIRTANLADFDQPKDVNGANLVPGPTDVVIDPQLGRFLMNLTALNMTAETVRVDYLLGPVRTVTAGKPFGLSSSIPEVFSFAAGGEMTRLRDTFDGTPISVKLRLGESPATFFGKVRGWTIYRNGVDVSGAMQVELKSLENVATAVTAGRVAVDLDRGRFKFAAGLLNPADILTVDFGSEDPVDTQRIFDSLTQRLPRIMPAGVVPVLIDTRRKPIDPSVLE